MKKFLILALVVFVAVFAMAEKLTILHINDTHGHAWTFDQYGVGLVGGFPLVATLVDQYRAENPRTLFLHAGDISTGVPESDLLDAAPDIVALNLMELDAVAIGNHEFDFEREVLDKQMEYALFPYLSANIYKDGEPEFTEYIIKDVGGIKVGIIGLTTPDTKILEKLHADQYEWKSVVDIAKKLVPEVETKADIVVILSHIGDAESMTDVNSHELAAAVDGIDVIVDGHSHTLTEKPVVINGTLIVQAGEWGKHLGKLDLEVENGGITYVEYEAIPVTAESIEPDKDVAIVLDYFKKLGSEKLNEVFGKTEILLMGDRSVIRSQDTNLAHLITDAMVWKTGADFAITNSGGIRASIRPGEISYRDILTVLPFGNTLYQLEATGEEVMDILEYTATVSAGQGAWPQVSGITYTIEGETVSDVMINGEPIDLDETYTIATNNYLAYGGDGYSMLEDLEGYDTGFVLADVVQDYVAEISPITDYDDEPRIIVK